MSHYNGSVWLHDNALIALGFVRYGFKEEVLKIFTGLYPIACSPQSWSAAIVFSLLQACLGLKILGTEKKISFTKPLLPDFLEEIQITGLRVKEAILDLSLTKQDEYVGINIIRRQS